MGRNFASATELIHQLNADLKNVGDMLPLVERHMLKEFADFALNNRAAIANAANLHPMEILVLLVLVEQQKQIQRIDYDIHKELERLKADLL